MCRIFSITLDAGIASIFLIPLFLYLNKHIFHDWKRTGAYILFGIYLSAIFSVVGLPDICYIRFEPNFNFVPFRYMFSDFKNSILNVLLFVPLGFFLPLLWEKFQSPRLTMLHGFCISLLIEFLQIFTFRATDVNDLITNTLGALIGWCLSCIFLRFFHFYVPGTRKKEVYLIYGTSFAVMFLIQPFLADWVWIHLY